MSTFKLNGKTVEAKPVGFNTVCKLEDYGLSLEDLGEKKFSLIQAYVAICLNCSLEDAGNAIETDPKAIEGILTAFGEEVDKSGFFRALQSAEEENAPTPQTAKKK